MRASLAPLVENLEEQQQMSGDFVGKKKYIYILKGKEEEEKSPTGCFQLQRRQRTEGGARGGWGQLERWARFGEGVG